MILGRRARIILIPSENPNGKSATVHQSPEELLKEIEEKELKIFQFLRMSIKLSGFLYSLLYLYRYNMAYYIESMVLLEDINKQCKNFLCGYFSAKVEKPTKRRLYVPTNKRAFSTIDMANLEV